MGIRPTIFARPVPPRVSLALAICVAVVVFAGGALQSYVAAIAAIAAAILTWWFGPLIGGIATGALTSLVVMVDPILPHPLTGGPLFWAITLLVMGMVTGMVARRS